jgi:hypothetical protein
MYPAPFIHVTLKTLQNAAATIGAHLEVKLVFNNKAA